MSWLWWTAICATLLIIFLYFIFLIYVRIKHPFWAIQPVAHFWSVFRRNGIIRKKLPTKNRYCNLINVQTYPFVSMSSEDVTKLTNFVALNYLKQGGNHFRPQVQNIVPYFCGDKFPSFVSFYQKGGGVTSNSDTENSQIQGVMTSRPLYVTFNPQKGCSKTETQMPVYYVDYLCVDKKYRKTGIAQTLIQTHEYIQSHANHQICVSLFKREEDLTAIVPLCRYNAYCYAMHSWKQPPALSAPYRIMKVDATNISYCLRYIITHGRQVTVMPALPTVLELVKTNNLFVFMLLKGADVCGVYVLKRLCTTLKQDEEILSCIGSICGEGVESYVFMHGFKLAVAEVIDMRLAFFCYLLVEDVSDNYLLVRGIKSRPMAVSPMAYFFYNYSYPVCKNSDVFLLV